MFTFDLQRFVTEPSDTRPKSYTYTLADGTITAVTKTANGVPFNEGMRALTKAIKAKIKASSSGTGGQVVVS